MLTMSQLAFKVDARAKVKVRVTAGTSPNSLDWPESTIDHT